MKQVLLVIGLAVGLGLGAQAQSAPADMVLLNGKIFTADAARSAAEALAIRGERIVAVGTVAEVSKLAGPKTRRINLQGHVVTPGFNDAHTHFGLNPAGVNLTFTSMEPTWTETAEAIRAAVQKAPAGTWIFGTVGYKVVLDTLVTRAALRTADLAVLSQDIFAVPPPELPKTTSVLTIIGGKIVHDAKVLK